MIIQVQDKCEIVNTDSVYMIYVADRDICITCKWLDEYVIGTYNSKAAAEYVFKSIRDNLMEGIGFYFMQSAETIDDVFKK